MQANRSLPQSEIARNGQPSLKARQFVLAFVPEKTQPNITKTWSDEASRTITALVDFRSAVHRWQAAGKVDDKEFVAEVERLESVGLSSWLDNLIALAMAGGES